MKKIERVGIIIKPHAPDIGAVLIQLIEYFEKKGMEYLLENAAAEIIDRQDGIPREDIPGSVDLVIVLGGDGTLLSIAQRAAVSEIPVLGVNLGSLGFLTEVPVDEMFLTLDAFFAGEKKIISLRQMLAVKTGQDTFHCLNDIVINKGALARMIQLRIWIDDKKIADLRSDGLIVSTPTGSTAYSLAAGGPIIYPHIPAMILAPICPHTLSFRPMVITMDSNVRIKLETGNEKVYLTLDGQRGGLISKDDVVEVRKSDHRLILVSSPKRNYFDLLQEKLGWG